MCDCAIFLCCLNLYRIYCLEYACLIISIIIFPLNIFGIFILKWEVIKLFCEIIYSINIPISIFIIFLISLIIYSTKIGKINTSELNKPFTYITIMSISLSIYLFLSYSFCSYQIFKDYLTFVKKNKFQPPSIEIDILKKKLKLNITWGFLCISTLLPTVLSFINILFWISIYYRISFKIYCSFNKEIRKELREQRRKNRQFNELKENNSMNEIDTNKEDKNKKVPKNIISVIIEKDRHPGASGILSNGEIFLKNNININKLNINSIPKNNEEYNQSDNNSSSARNLGKIDNEIKT